MTFDFVFDPLYRAAALAFGVTESRTGVDVEDGRLVARYGFWRLETGLENVAGVEVSGPYRLLTTIGPAHLSLADLGLTFASNRDRGLCIKFREPVPGLVPTERLRHPGLTVTVADVDGLAAALRPTDEVSLEGEYEPSTEQWVRDQVAEYERSGGVRANTLRDTGLSVIIVTTRGNKSGKLRKTPLMRVEHDGEYALVASRGGAPTHPVWYYNLKADPDAVTIQDGPEPFNARVREVAGTERDVWWERAVAAFPPYAEYQTGTDRLIPVFVAVRR